ncbi:MAG: asparaginase domain-containing protein [Candidatus Acidiferrales bacterium]|jgi:L-asparaginase
MRVIYLVTTGGTIEKAYSEQTGSVADPGNKVGRYLQRLRLPDSEVNVVPLLNKDSLELTDADRELILATVRGLLHENAPIIITHDADTIVPTGRLLKRALPEIDVPVVLTGAMAPLGFEASDGLQNLTESLFAVRLLPPGIYVVMHNQVSAVDAVSKDHKLSRFISADRRPN